jgi:hypothetical protein
MAAHLRADLDVVNSVLAENKLPAFTEPEHLPALRSRSVLQNLGYSHLGGLKRTYAYAAKYPDWWPTPPADGLRVYEDPIFAEDAIIRRSHLLHHSDADGFYVPVDFESPIANDRVYGRILGAQVALPQFGQAAP